MTDNQRMGFDALLAALKAHGICPSWTAKEGEHQPELVVSEDDWREVFYNKYKAKKPDCKGDTPRNQFNRARRELVEAQAVTRHDDGYFWPTPEQSPSPTTSPIKGIPGLMDIKL
jgi:hypothetical protein